ncbi:MAG: NnrU family protein [Xanthomonadales bacterium]|nr:NnrU family protein [Xanthomonadales bacterium]
MPILILGLLVFLGVHSLRVFADDWRTRQIARFGEKPWKGLFTLASLLGFVLLCWGFGLARAQPVLLYTPPLALRHLNALFTLIAFVLLAAAYVPRNHLKARFGHPMLLGVKVWAFGHLLATGMLHDVVLFGAFLLWAMVLYVVSRRRDRLAGTVYPGATLGGDAASVIIGVVAWAIFMLWLHLWLIGVNPMS